MRDRATRAELEHRHDVLFEICQRDQPLSVRNAYYQAQTRGIATKGAGEYRKVQRAILDMRRAERLPYPWIVDNSRTSHRARVHDSLEDALQETARTYRRNLWRTAPKRVEVWCESDSIAGVILDVAFEWQVSVFPTKGQPSESFVYSAGNYSEWDGRPLVVLYLGDLDPAGLEITDETHRKLQRFAPSIEIEWRRLGVTLEQIEELNLIGKGNVPKKTADWFPYDETFECEAIPAPQLRQILGDEISGYVDQRHLGIYQTAENSERQIMQRIAGKYRSDPAGLVDYVYSDGAA